MPLVVTQDLVKIYRLGPTEVRALDGIDLEIEAGEFVSIMGRSGSGKSTLLNMIGCLDRPSRGRVFLDSIEVTSIRGDQLPRLRRERIGFVFQHYNLIPTLTALENVMLPLRYAGVSWDQRRERARRVLVQVGLAERESHRPAELSGGEQQRVAIARALVNHPAVVLADEPTGELDSHTAREIIRMMKRLNGEDGQTIIVVTHDPIVANETRRIIRLNDGRIESDIRVEALAASYKEGEIWWRS